MGSGFLSYLIPTRASLFPDIVVVSLFIVLPAFFYGARLASKGKTRGHAAIMSSVFSVLFVVVVAFVLWNQFWNTSDPPIHHSPLYKTLYVPLAIFHVIIAVSGTLLGLFLVVTGSLWREKKDDGELIFKSAKHRRIHIVSGKIALTLFVLIAITGLAIYYLRYIWTP